MGDHSSKGLTSMDRLKELRIDRNERPAKGSSGWWWIAVVLIVLVLAGGVWWWMQREEAPTVRVRAVERISSAEQAATTVLDASGYVVARLRATISSKVTGKIVEVLVDEGMEIEEGQLLARLDDATPKRMLDLAEAELASARGGLKENEVRLAEAELELARTRELVVSEVSSQSDLDTAQASVDALKARIELGRQQIEVAERTVSVRQQDLEDTEIRAPFSGVAVTKNAQPGEMISPVSAGGGFTRTGVCTLVDMSSLEIEVDVNEAYINRVTPGQRVEASLDAYPDWRIPASVITTVPTADRQKATVRVRIAFDGLDPRILPDMGAKVSFLEDRPEPASEVVAEPVLLMPLAALRKEGDQSIAFVFGGEMVERRAVTVGEIRGELIVVEAGLRAGDNVVVVGPEDLADGDRVREETETD